MKLRTTLYGFFDKRLLLYVLTLGSPVLHVKEILWREWCLLLIEIKQEIRQFPTVLSDFSIRASCFICAVLSDIKTLDLTNERSKILLHKDREISSPSQEKPR